MNFWKFIKDTITENQVQEEQNQETSESQAKQKQRANEEGRETRKEQNQETRESQAKQKQRANEEGQETKEEQNQETSASQAKQKQKANEEGQETKEEQNQETSATKEKQKQRTNEEGQETKEKTKKEKSSSQEKQNQKTEQNTQEQSDSIDKTNNSNQNKTSQEQNIPLEKQRTELEERKKKIQQLAEKLKQYADKKKQQETELPTKKVKSHISKEEKETQVSQEQEYELSEQTNQFLTQLNELPSFKDRDKGPGYSIDTNSFTELPDSMIRTLITKFLNQRFCKHSTDLNLRNNSLEKSRGFYKWEVKDVIKHLNTHQITKVLDDKYGYEYANGKNENIPLSFYFDMSGSMSNFTNLLAVIAIELLKKNVKVLIGFNERVNIQIEYIKKNIDVKELTEILKRVGWYGYNGNDSKKETIQKESKIGIKYINRNIDNYLLSKKAEKCVVFSDFDPIDEVINLSQKTEVYWFCFETTFSRYDLYSFNGFIYKVNNAKDIAEGLIKINEKKFETLIYTDNPQVLRKKREGNQNDNY